MNYSFKPHALFARGSIVDSYPNPLIVISPIPSRKMYRRYSKVQRAMKRSLRRHNQYQYRVYRTSRFAPYDRADRLTIPTPYINCDRCVDNGIVTTSSSDPIMERSLTYNSEDSASFAHNETTYWMPALKDGYSDFGLNFSLNPFGSMQFVMNHQKAEACRRFEPEKLLSS